jgi:hypothetical protein
MYITFPHKFDLQKPRIKMVLIIFLCYTGHDLQIFVAEEEVNSTHRCWKGNEADVKRGCNFHRTAIGSFCTTFPPLILPLQLSTSWRNMT